MFRAPLATFRLGVRDGLAIVAILLVLPGSQAHAYLDPGTGSALLYLISGLVLSLYFGARGLYHKVVERLFRVRFENQKCELAIHSEDPRYETTFMPMIRGLAEKNVPFTYFTMYERGEGFEPLPAQATHQAIPNGLVGYSFLNNLEAKLFVTTTPQLDVMMFRRSPRVKHYLNVQHALCESRFARPFAYDFFDSVMCCGPLLRQNLRILETKRRMPEKKLLDTGVPHYDVLLERARAVPQEPRPKTVLIAPSWGPMSLFTCFGTDFVRAVAARYRVVVRPHPQMRISQAELYAQILAIEGVTVDTARTPTQAMSSADIVISDISGISYEFAFLYERPVIVVDHKLGVDALEGALLGDVKTLQELCGEFLVAIPPSEMQNNLVAHVDDVLSKSLPERIAQVRGELVHNFGNAGSVAAQQIQELLTCL